ncbi:hypothetical protein BDZ89DRAFT_1068129 [Hymenopellis radicata]|nr:hypothetical protein BDZ89DRAFT_1068129 [Hymenopellis radicata]
MTPLILFATFNIIAVQLLLPRDHHEPANHSLDVRAILQDIMSPLSCLADGGRRALLGGALFLHSVTRSFSYTRMHIWMVIHQPSADPPLLLLLLLSIPCLVILAGLYIYDYKRGGTNAYNEYWYIWLSALGSLLCDIITYGAVILNYWYILFGTALAPLVLGARPALYVLASVTPRAAVFGGLMMLERIGSQIMRNTTTENDVWSGWYRPVLGLSLDLTAVVLVGCARYAAGDEEEEVDVPTSAP